MEFYGDRNPVRRWQSMLRRATREAFIVSPFITPRTAPSVVRAFRGETLRIVTDLDPRAFLLGGSSLRCVTRLFRLNDVELYTLSRVHSKIVLVPDDSVSVGSQNLTEGANQNFESSLVTSDPRILKDIHDFVRGLIEAATKVTWRDLEEIQEVVDKLQGPQIREVKENISRARRSKNRILGLDPFWSQSRQRDRLPVKPTIPESCLGKHCEVVYFDSTSGGNYSLASHGRGFLSWNMGEDRFRKLKKSRRYLCLVADSGNLGWARVFPSRITKISRTIAWNRPLEYKGIGFDITYRGIWNDEMFNVEVEVDGGSLVCRGWYDLRDYKVVEVERRGGGMRYRELQRAFVTEEEVLMLAVIDRLRRPFQYVEGARLSGEEADEFFGEIGSEWKLRLDGREGSEIIVAEAA